MIRADPTTDAGNFDKPISISQHSDDLGIERHVTRLAGLRTSPRTVRLLHSGDRGRRSGSLPRNAAPAATRFGHVKSPADWRRRMNEVYRAGDTRLDRDVAPKVVPEEFISDRQRRALLARGEDTAVAESSAHRPRLWPRKAASDAEPHAPSSDEPSMARTLRSESCASFPFK